MPTFIPKNPFTNLKAAAVKYEAGAKKRQKLFEAVESDAQWEAFEKVDKAATAKLCEAFYLDTQEYNRHYDCMQMTAESLLKIARGEQRK